MEHAFDKLSKQLARGVSRREAIGTLLRGAVGAFLVSAGFSKFSLRAQSGACSACGTCLMTEGSDLVTCTESCEAQTLCNTAQSDVPYQSLASMLAGIGLQAATYVALIYGTGKKQTQVFHTPYVNPTDSSSTADLFVVWSPNSQVATYAVQYQNGSPLWVYYVSGTSVVQIPPPPQIPPLFSISASPSAVSVAPGSSVTSTISSTVLSGFSSAIKLMASGLPSGATASFKPSSIKAPGSGSSIMTIKAGASTPTGTYTITVTGTGQEIPEATSILLTVSSPEDLVGSLAGPDRMSAGDLEPFRVGSSNAEIIPDITNKYCPIPCWVLEKAATIGAGVGCGAAAAAITAGACATAGPLFGICEALVFASVWSATAACVAAANKAAELLCKWACKCPPCTVNQGGLTCSPMCVASQCPPGSTCDPMGCGCACPNGGIQCGDTCCLSGQTCCDGACAPAGYTCCGGEYACAPGTYCCAPHICCGNDEICCGTTCCGTGYECCLGSQYGDCQPATCPCDEYLCTNGTENICCAQGVICCGNANMLQCGGCP